MAATSPPNADTTTDYRVKTSDRAMDGFVPGDELLKVEGLTMHFPITSGAFFRRQVGAVRAVDGLDFSIKKGETLGLVGESGCGKSTAGRAILQLYKPTAGKVIFKGRDIVQV